mgnify:CR=1 FL=1
MTKSMTTIVLKCMSGYALPGSFIIQPRAALERRFNIGSVRVGGA